MPAIDFLPYNVKRRQLFVKPYGYVAVSGGHSPFDWTTTRAKQPARAVSTDPIETYDTGSPYTANRARAFATSTPVTCPVGTVAQAGTGLCVPTSFFSSGSGSGTAGAGGSGSAGATLKSPPAATLSSRFQGVNPATDFTQNPIASASSNQFVARIQNWVKANPTAVIAVVVVGITLAIIGPRF